MGKYLILFWFHSEGWHSVAPIIAGMHTGRHITGLFSRIFAVSASSSVHMRSYDTTNLKLIAYDARFWHLCIWVKIYVYRFSPIANAVYSRHQVLFWYPVTHDSIVIVSKRQTHINLQAYVKGGILPEAVRCHVIHPSRINGGKLKNQHPKTIPSSGLTSLLKQAWLMSAETSPSLLFMPQG